MSLCRMALRKDWMIGRMTESEARGFIQGKLNCMERCDRFDCKNTDECDNCEYCYSQGNFGEQKEAFKIAIKALEKQEKIKEVFTHYPFIGIEISVLNDCVSALSEIKTILKE